MEKKKQFDYKWVIVAVSFLMVMISLGFASSTRSLFPDEIAKDLEVQRSLIAIGDSIRFVATAVINLFFGSLIVKLGPKKLILAGFVCLTASMLCYATAENLILIYIGGALLGIGFSWTSTTMVGYIINVWCKENKGTIMGAVLASNGLGGAIAIQVVGSVIDPTVTGSYRKAYFLIAAVMTVMAVIMLIFFRDKPKDADPSVLAAPEKKKKKRGRDWAGVEFSVLLKKPYFWAAMLCIFCTGLILQGTGGISAMHMKDVGVDYDRVKALLSFGSLILAGSKFLTGFLYDRFGLRTTATSCTLLAIISCFVLIAVQPTNLGFVLAIIYVILHQCALPLETIMLPIYAADLFGQRSYNKVLGICVSVNTAGYACGGYLMNLCFDIFDSYVPALYIVGFLTIAILILLQFVISAAHREQKRVMEEEQAALEAASATA
ncbi:MAG: MFS transporter [Clostridia bacterium]|nr:MFS transporter [Clostridia bacterium]